MNAYHKHEDGHSSTPSFLEGWPLTLVAVGATAWHYWGYVELVVGWLK